MEESLRYLNQRLASLAMTSQYISALDNNAGSSQSVEKWLADCDSHLTHLEHDLSVIHAYLTSESMKLEQSHSMIAEINDLHAQQEQLNQMLALPEVQAELQQQQHEQDQENVQKVRFHPNVVTSTSRDSSSSSASEHGAIKKPAIQSLTAAQLQKVPRYICSVPNMQKALVKMNENIATLNQLFAKKQLVNMQDLRNGGWQWDSSAKTLIAVLRHMHLIREQRINSVICYSLTTGGS